MSDYVWQDKISRKTAHKKRVIEREAKAKDEEAFLQALNAGIETVPYRIIDGLCEERFIAPVSCTGLIIGKKGENLKGIQERFKVTVKLEGDKKLGEPPEVVIRGARHRDVEAAKKELDFTAEEVEVPREMIGWVCGKGNRHLKHFKELTGVLVLSLRVEGEGEAEAEEVAVDDEEEETDKAAKESPALGDSCWIDVKGLRTSVTDAVMCLETHMSYYPVFSEMNKVEEDLDRQLAEARSQLGRRAGQPIGQAPSANGNSTGNAGSRKAGTREPNGNRTSGQARRPDG